MRLPARNCVPTPHTAMTLGLGFRVRILWVRVWNLDFIHCDWRRLPARKLCRLACTQPFPIMKYAKIQDTIKEMVRVRLGK